MKKQIFPTLLAGALLTVFAMAFTTANKTNLPDLKIETVKIVCEKQRWLVFEVSNIGTVKSEPTIIRIRPENNNDPTQKCIAKAVEHVPIIQPGKTFKIRVPLKDSDGCDCKSNMKFELFVDHRDYVKEADEKNNVFLYKN